MLADVEAGIAEAKMVASGSKGVIRIGYSPTAIFTGLADAITRFADSNPLVELRLREASAAALYEQFSRGDFDMIIVRADGSKQPATSVKLVEDRILALLPEDHPAPPDRPVSLTQLNQGRFVFFRRAAAPEYVDRIMTAAYAGGLRPVSVQEVDSWSAALALVRSGFGFTLATAFYQSFQISGARFSEILEPLPDVGFRLVFDRDRLTPSAERFITQLRSLLPAA
jgi:DNA-binding transcriptional LysR family regulator